MVSKTKRIFPFVTASVALAALLFVRHQISTLGTSERADAPAESLSLISQLINRIVMVLPLAAVLLSPLFGIDVGRANYRQESDPRLKVLSRLGIAFNVSVYIIMGAAVVWALYT